MIKFEPIDLSQYVPSCPEDVLTISDDDAVVCDNQEEGSLDVGVAAEAIALIREAKERHLPIMITNHDNSRALVIKDANDLKGHMSFNGIPFVEI